MVLAVGWASQDFNLVPIGDITVSKVDALVGAGPLESTVTVCSPELVGVSIDAVPDFEFGAICVHAIFHF